MHRIEAERECDDLATQKCHDIRVVAIGVEPGVFHRYHELIVGPVPPRTCLTLGGLLYQLQMKCHVIRVINKHQLCGDLTALPPGTLNEDRPAQWNKLVFEKVLHPQMLCRVTRERYLDLE